MPASRRADAGALSAGYERLRSAVLSGGAGGWRLGHGVLATRGTAAWMAAVGELAPASGSQRPERPSPSLNLDHVLRCQVPAKSLPCSRR